MIDAYRVRYKDWGSRFVEWVKPNRVVEPTEHNRLLQDELLEERQTSRCGLPPILNNLYANDYLHACDRARVHSQIPDFGRIVQVKSSNPSASDESFPVLKAALLAIEAALPVGSVDTREKGRWRPDFAKQWRRFVVSAEGPASLTQCTIVLEDAIVEDRFKEDINHIRSCLPARWKAVAEASVSSLAMRILVLDRALLYCDIDRKKFSKKKRKR
jgi:hypothetical protein